MSFEKSIQTDIPCYLKQIKEIIEEELCIYKQLVDQSEKKRSILVTGNVDKLIKFNNESELILLRLKVLEEAYKCPVDIEFSHDGQHLYFLQTRPLAQALKDDAGIIPKSISPQDKIFSTQRYVCNGFVDDIKYIIYCDPRAYLRLENDHERYQLARIVGKLNQELMGKNFILMGPGRWGSNNIQLGIPVQYSEISNTKALIEIAYRKGDYTPEVSFGTHFFLDLVERGIHYLPLFPDDSDNAFNHEFFTSTPNTLGDLLPEAAQFAHCIKVIDIHRALGGNRMNLRMNSQIPLALAYLVNGT